MSIQNKIDSDQLGSIVNVNATDHGDASEVGSLKYVCDLLGSESKTITLEKGTYSVGTSFTIPSNVAIRMNNGAILEVATGVTLTINGPFEAGSYQVFDCVGTGAVTFGSGSVSEVYPEWWGENITPGATDMTAAVQTAINTLKTKGGIVKFQSTQYALTTIIMNSSDYSGIQLVGSSMSKTVLTFSTTGTALTIGESPGAVTGHIVVEEMTINSPNSNTMISIINSAQCLFRRIYTSANGNTGANSKGYNINETMSITFDKISYGGNVNAKYGIYLVNDSCNIVIKNSYIKGEPTLSFYSIVVLGVGTPVVIKDSIIGGGSLASIIVGLGGSSNGVQIRGNYFEGSATGIQLGVSAGPYVARNISIEDNYFYNPSSYGVYLSETNYVIIRNNYFWLGATNIYFNSNITKNQNVIVELNRPGTTLLSIPLEQDNVLYQDANGYYHDRLTMLTNFGMAWVATIGAIADGGALSIDVTVTGAALGDFAVAALNLDTQGLVLSAAVKSANTVTVTLANNTGGPVTIGSSVVYVKVFKL